MKKAQKVFIISALATFFAFVCFFVILISISGGMANFHLGTDLRNIFTITNTISGEQIVIYTILALTLIYLIIWLVLAIRRKRPFSSYLGMIILLVTIFVILVVWVEATMFKDAIAVGGTATVVALFTLFALVFFIFFGLLTAFNGIALDAKQIKTADELQVEEEIEADEVEVARNISLQEIRKIVKEELSHYNVASKDAKISFTINMNDSYIKEEIIDEEIIEEETPIKEEVIIEEQPHEEVKEEPIVEEVVEEVHEAEPEVVEEIVEEVEEVEEEVEEKVEEDELIIAEEIEKVEPIVIQEVSAEEIIVPAEESEEEKIRRIPFPERFATLDQDIVDKFNDIKSYALAYGLKSRVSNSGDTFRLHRKTYLKIMIAGKGLKIHYALDPADYEDSTIPVKDYAHVKLYEEIPAQLKVKSELSVKRAKMLIDDVCKAEGLEQKEYIIEEHSAHFVVENEDDED